MRKFSICVLIIISLVFSSSVARALELVRQKNAATYIVVPIVDADGDIVTGAAGLDSEIDTFTDGAAPDGFTDCTNEATEIGSTGIYYLSLAQAEMNADYIYIQIKTSTSGAKSQHILIRTTIGDPLNAATTDDGGTINVSSGKIDEVSTLTGNTAQTGDAYGIVNNGTYGNSALEGLVDDLEGRLTAARAGYLDKLNVSGTLANTDNAASFKATGFSTHSAADVVTAMQAVASDFKADVSGLATSVELTAVDGKIDAAQGDITDILEDTGTTLPTTLSSMAGATFNTSTDSLEALRNRGDSAWITATGFSTLTAQQVWEYGTRALTDKSGFALTQAFPSNFSALSISATTGLVDITQTAADKVWGTSTRALTDKSGFGISSAAAGDYSEIGTDVWATAARTLTTGAYAGLTASDVDAIWDEVTTGHSTASSFGKLLIDDIDAKISTRSSHSAADVWSNGTRTLTAGTNISLAKGTGVTGFNDIAATDVWSVATRQLTALDEDVTTIDLNGSAIGSVTNAVTVGTNNDKTGYGLASSQTFNMTGSITGNLSGSVGSVTGSVGSVTSGVTVTTNSDKTGYSLTQAFPTNFSSLAITVAGAVTAGTVSDKTGYSLTQTFPSNFSSLAITGAGAVTAGTVSDKTGYALTQSFPANFSSLSIDGTGQITVADISSAALAKFFTQDSGSTYAVAVDGSVVKEIVDNVEDTATVTDWTAGEKEQIRDALGVAGDKATSTSGVLQRIDKNTKMIR